MEIVCDRHVHLHRRHDAADVRHAAIAGTSCPASTCSIRRDWLLSPIIWLSTRPRASRPIPIGRATPVKATMSLFFADGRTGDATTSSPPRSGMCHRGGAGAGHRDQIERFNRSAISGCDHGSASPLYPADSDLSIVLRAVPGQLRERRIRTFGPIPMCHHAVDQSAAAYPPRSRPCRRSRRARSLR